ncbi:MAG TPA: conjugal transfer protein [Solirubrobacteraceae bacterium]|nr:conjugal transfer protein [Solirubrobacteraceae bacterium]
MREVRGIASPDPPARVLLKTRPLWKIRLTRELPRYTLYALSIAGLAASARFAIAPPRPPHTGAPPPRPFRQDLAAEGYAQLFTRDYLTWQANAPEAHQRALAQFTGPALEPDVGLQPPPTGEEQVQWTDVVQEREATADQRVYTVAAQTDTAGLLFLAVTVLRVPGGALELASYPAFVGAPATAPADVEARSRELTEPALRVVVERALRNYLASSGTELAADLTEDAQVSLPAQSLAMENVQRLSWSAEGGDAVSAVVQARDWRGTRYTLAYDLDVRRVATRWEVSAIEMDPDT